jgi:hypothetical protein
VEAGEKFVKFDIKCAYIGILEKKKCKTYEIKIECIACLVPNKMRKKQKI